MRAYQDLLRLVLERGTPKPTRAKLLSTGKHVNALSVFGTQFRCDLRNGFPALTTKSIPIRWVAVELAWFLRGDTNVKYLQDHGVTIWDQWATAEQTARFGREIGALGPIYGSQWRSFQDEMTGGIDQIENLIRDIEAVKADPFASCARRLIVTAWHPGEATMVALPPCHTWFQFNVTNGALSCHMVMRSADLFIGVPFNIASYALLTHIIANTTGLGVGELIVSFSDLHIYDNCIAQVHEQLSREPFPLPTLVLGQKITDVDSFDPVLVRLIDYNHYEAIKAEVAV